MDGSWTHEKKKKKSWKWTYKSIHEEDLSISNVLVTLHSTVGCSTTGSSTAGKSIHSFKYLQNNEECSWKSFSLMRNSDISLIRVWEETLENARILREEKGLWIWPAAWDIPKTVKLTLIYALTSNYLRTGKKQKKYKKRTLSNYQHFIFDFINQNLFKRPWSIKLDSKWSVGFVTEQIIGKGYHASRNCRAQIYKS